MYLIAYAAMKRTTVFLADEQVKKLTALFQKTGARPAEIIRRALNAYLDAQLKKGAK